MPWKRKVLDYRLAHYIPGSRREKTVLVREKLFNYIVFIMGEIVGTIESKSGSHYLVEWENSKVWISEKGTLGWFCVALKVKKVDALSSAQKVLDNPNPAF